jgi:lipopolysaccharide heptosyltransferase I
VAGSTQTNAIPSRILLIRLSALGDVIRTLPLLAPLRHRFPLARISWLCEPAQEPVVAPQPLVDEVLIFPRRDLARALSSGRLARVALRSRSVVRELRRRRFDIVLDAQGTYKSGILMRLSGAPLRIGFARGAAKEYLPGAANRLVTPDPPRQSRVDKALALLGPLEADPSRARAELPVVEELARQAAGIWAEEGAGARVILSPGASSRQDYKRWPADRFAAVGAGLAAAGARVRVAWGPGEEDLAAQVESLSGGTAQRLPPTSLPLLAETLRAADLFIGNDSGPMHLAWLVGTPVVAIYGPTDPILNAPWGSGHRQVALPEERRRALGRDAALMTEIEPATVLAAAQECLDEQGEP